MNMMNEQFTKQAESFLRAAQDGRMPENLQALAQDTVAKTREAYEKIAAATADSAKVIEAIAAEQQVGAKSLFETALKHFTKNAEAAFDAATAIARAGSLPEAAKAQVSYVQHQLAASSEQTREILELSTKLAKQSMETVGAAANKTFGQFKG